MGYFMDYKQHQRALQECMEEIRAIALAALGGKNLKLALQSYAQILKISQEMQKQHFLTQKAAAVQSSSALISLSQSNDAATDERAQNIFHSIMQLPHENRERLIELLEREMNNVSDDFL